MAKLPNRRSNLSKISIRHHWPKHQAVTQAHPDFTPRKSEGAAGSWVTRLQPWSQLVRNDGCRSLQPSVDGTPQNTRRKHINALMIGLQCVARSDSGDPTLTSHGPCSSLNKLTAKRVGSVRAILASTQRFLSKMRDHRRIHSTFNHATCCGCQGVRAVRESSYRRLVQAVQLQDEQEYDTSVKILRLLHPEEEASRGSDARV